MPIVEDQESGLATFMFFKSLLNLVIFWRLSKGVLKFNHPGLRPASEE
jgi:hypothetical protein